jgi:hypothetical protein
MICGGPGSRRWFFQAAENLRRKNRKRDPPEKSDVMRRAPAAAGKSIRNAAADRKPLARKILCAPLQPSNQVIIVNLFSQGIIG